MKNTLPRVELLHCLRLAACLINRAAVALLPGCRLLSGGAA